jgi:hypothetical protein
MTEIPLPTFLVIGAMKAGTTSLYEYLRAHPSVFMPREKEPEFFSEPERWSRGLDWYSSLFAPGTHHPVRGEASTGYTRHPRFPETPARIASTLPDVKLLYLVRDPIGRMLSHYRHSVLLGREHRGVDDALRGGGGYLDTSRYALQLRRYLDHFPASQILVVFSEDLRSARLSTLRRIVAFVGADPSLIGPHPTVEHHVSERRLLVPTPVRRMAERPAMREMRRRFPGISGHIRGWFARRHTQLNDEPSASTRTLLREWLADDLDDLHRLVGPLPAAWTLGE